MSITEVVSLHDLSLVQADKVKEVVPFGFLSELGKCRVYTDYQSKWVAIEDEGPLFRVRFDTRFYSGNKNDSHATLEIFKSTEELDLKSA